MKYLLNNYSNEYEIHESKYDNPIQNIKGNVVLISAARDNQYSYESFKNGKTQGNFTYNVCRILKKCRNQNISLEKCPALVLNADYRPLSYYPLSLWSWQDSIKSVFLDRVTIVSYYDRQIRSPSFSMKLPSVIALKSYIRPQSNPNFTRFNVFLRDKFSCQYCGSKNELTFDHLLPRSKGGKTDWDNVVTACSACNVKKGGRLIKDSGMTLNQWPFQPTTVVLVIQ